MSIHNRFMAPDKWYRSFFILFILLIGLIVLFPLRSFANEAQDKNVVFTKSIYHSHTGSSASGGGCYSVKRTGTRTERCSGGGQVSNGPHGPDTSGQVYYVGRCAKCGERLDRYGSPGYENCDSTTTVSYTYYDLGCNQVPSAEVGILSVEQDTTEWAKEVVFTASYEITGSLNVAEAPYIWNGEAATSQNIYTATENGDYFLQLNADANADTETGKIVIPVRNIDITAPVIASHIQEPENGWVKEGVLLTIEDVQDLQPDNTEGCGLHEEPYSYDNGMTWTADNAHLYGESGNYTVMVRDKLENSSSYEVSFSHIDNLAPTIESVEYDDTPNVLSVSIVVTATDIQPDGSEGCGLHELPYSFDGGNTWTNNPEYVTDRNGTIIIAVRDALGNTVYHETVINNIDGCGPRVSYDMNPDSWTNGSVYLHLKAEDVNADGSFGIGLPDTWYSLDGGQTWGNKAELEYSQNQKVSVIARDKYDNRTHMDISIHHIDTDAPWVSLEMEVTGEGNAKEVRLIADGEDGGSGLHEQAYSWDNGAVYGNEKTLTVSGNGLYEVVVRDKAGNRSHKQIEVNVFEEPVEELIPMIEKVVPVQVEETVFDEEEETMEEVEYEPVIVKAAPKAEPVIIKPVPVTEESVWDITDTFAVVGICVGGLGLLFVLIFCLMRTIAVYAEDEHERKRYLGRQWIRHHDERYEVRFTEELLERCVTTHFYLRPFILFWMKHKGTMLSLLFPEDICIVQPIEKEMEFSLL